MSGGSYNYAYQKVIEFADDLSENGSCSAAPPILRRAFSNHLRLVAEAMRACEWNDSCDGHDGETELINKVLSKGELEPAIREEFIRISKSLLSIVNILQ